MIISDQDLRISPFTYKLHHTNGTDLIIFTYGVNHKLYQNDLKQTEPC